MSPSPSSSAGPGYGLGPAATPRCQQPARNAEGGAAPPPPPASPPPACAAAALRECGDPARPTGSAAAAMAGEVKTKLSKNLLRMKVRWGAGSGRPEELSAGTGGKGRPGRAGPGCGAAGSGWGGPGSALTPGCSGPPPVGAAPLPPSRCPSLGSGYFHFLHLSTRLLFWHSECLLCPLRDAYAFTYVQTRVFSSVFSLRPATV